MSGKEVDSVVKSFSVTSALREAAFANTIFSQKKWQQWSKIGSKLVQSDQRSWSMKLPQTGPSYFKENTGTEETTGTISSTVRFVLTCVRPLRVSRTLLEGWPRNYFSDLLWRRALGAISTYYERRTQIMLSSFPSSRSTSETSQDGTP